MNTAFRSILLLLLIYVPFSWAKVTTPRSDSAFSVELHTEIEFIFKDKNGKEIASSKGKVISELKQQKIMILKKPDGITRIIIESKKGNTYDYQLELTSKREMKARVVMAAETTLLYTNPDKRIGETSIWELEHSFKPNDVINVNAHLVLNNDNISHNLVITDDRNQILKKSTMSKYIHGENIFYVKKVY